MNFVQKLYQAHKLALMKIFFFLPRGFRLFNARLLSILLCFFEFLTIITVTLSLLFTLTLRSGLADNYLTKITKDGLALLTPEMMGGMYFEVGEISFEQAISIKDFKLNDDYGTWLEVGELAIDFPSLQVLMFFSSIDINSIKGSNISQYRNPRLRQKPEEEKEDEDKRGWMVPSIVMPQILGKINIDSIDLDNVFVSKEVMYLSGFDVDLHADVSMKAEISHMKAEFTDVRVKEEQTNVTGTIIYTPATFTCDLVAHDRRWGRVFPLIDDAKLHAKIKLVAKELPPTPEFPLTVDLKSNVVLAEFLWLRDEVVIDSEVSTFFSFDGTNVLFKDTNLYSEFLDIEIPHFNLNLENSRYDKTEAKVRVGDLGLLFNGIHGQSEGLLTFWGEIFDMHAKVELDTKDLRLNYYPEEYLSGREKEFVKIVSAKELETVVTANINLLGERLKLSGYVDAFSKNINLLKNGKTSSFDFETAYLFDIKTFDFTDISLILDEAILHSEALVLDFENTKVEEDEMYIPFIRGKAVIDASNLSFLDADWEFPIQSDAYVELFAVKGQKMHIDAALYNLDFPNTTLKELTLNTDVLDFNNFYYGKYPRLEGNLFVRDLQLKEVSKDFNIPNQLLEEVKISFSDPLKTVENEIDIALSSKGVFELDAKASINFFSKYLKIEILRADSEHTKQRLELDKPITFDFASSYKLSPTKLYLFENNKKASVELDFNYTADFIDLYLKTDIASSFVNSYLKNTLFPTGMFKVDVDLSGPLANPQGTLALAYSDIEFVRNSAKLHLNLDGLFKNNQLLMDMKFGRKRKTEFQANASLPLALAKGTLFDEARAFSFDFNWLGNIGTFLQLYPLLDFKLDGNAKIDLSMNGTLAEPKYNIFAYISKASLISDLNALYLNDIDLELKANDLRSELIVRANDANSSNSVKKTVEQVKTNKETIIKSREKFQFVQDKATLSKQGQENKAKEVEIKKYNRNDYPFYLNAYLDKVEDQYRINASAVMNSFSPFKFDGLNLVFSSQLNAKGMLNSPDINGEVFINEASFDFSKLKLNSKVDALQNLQIVRNEDAIEKISFRTLRAKTFRPSTNIRLIIPDNLILYGMGLGSVWGGELSINSRTENLNINGNLTSTKGSFNFLSKNFDLANSIISFTGDPAKPFYEVAFERSNQVIESIVKIKGIGEDLQIELTSNPQLPIDEIISQTLYGKELADLSQFQAIQVGTTTAQLLSPGLQKLNFLNVAKKTFGLDVLTLGSKDSLTKKQIEEENDLNDATIEAGTYIGDKVYLGVEQGLEDTAVKIEVEVLPSVDVKARLGTDDSEAELRWKKNY